jgi:hypothetical protein
MITAVAIVANAIDGYCCRISELVLLFLQPRAVTEDCRQLGIIRFQRPPPP